MGDVGCGADARGLGPDESKLVALEATSAAVSIGGRLESESAGTDTSATFGVLEEEEDCMYLRDVDNNNGWDSEGVLLRGSDVLLNCRGSRDTDANVAKCRRVGARLNI